MKKLVLTLITLVGLCSTHLTEGATRYVTLIKDGGNQAFTVANIAAGEVAFIEYHYKSGGKNNYVSVTKEGVSMNIEYGAKNIPVAGPATISLNMPLNDSKAIISLKIEPNPNIGGVGQ